MHVHSAVSVFGDVVGLLPWYDTSPWFDQRDVTFTNTVSNQWNYTRNYIFHLCLWSEWGIEIGMFHCQGKVYFKYEVLSMFTSHTESILGPMIELLISLNQTMCMKVMASITINTLKMFIHLNNYIYSRFVLGFQNSGYESDQHQNYPKL